jgi:[pyruvate, water dikinase]-phosphate phosphotransferase / [pyruvate, water dikinase] kinase
VYHPSEEAETVESRTVFFVSDNTGVTAETFGQSLIVQFDDMDFHKVTVPFVTSLEKAQDTVNRINQAGRDDGFRPVVFSTLVKDEVRRVVRESDGLFLDFFDAFLAPLEKEFKVPSAASSGRAHGILDLQAYTDRIEATNYALATDDGSNPKDYDEADVILMGVSRSGKTPTCLYLALQYGVYAANYPLTEEDLEDATLPALLMPHRSKLYGLTISPSRLFQVRKERRAQGRYASQPQVNFELRQAEAIFRRHGVDCIDTTMSSIEEIASTILDATGVARRL